MQSFGACPGAVQLCSTTSQRTLMSCGWSSSKHRMFLVGDAKTTSPLRFWTPPGGRAWAEGDAGARAVGDATATGCNCAPPWHAVVVAAAASATAIAAGTLGGNRGLAICARRAIAARFG